MRVLSLSLSLTHTHTHTHKHTLQIHGSIFRHTVSTHTRSLHPRSLSLTHTRSFSPSLSLFLSLSPPSGSDYSSVSSNSENTPARGPVMVKDKTAQQSPIVWDGDGPVMRTVMRTVMVSQ